jgi:hypothetical protein
LCGTGVTILDGGDFQADGLQSADGGFAAGSRAFDADFDLAHAVGHGLPGGVLGHLLGGEGGAFARAFETDPPALDQPSTLPCMSVMVTLVLLKVAKMLAMPTAIFLAPLALMIFLARRRRRAIPRRWARGGHGHGGSGGSGPLQQAAPGAAGAFPSAAAGFLPRWRRLRARRRVSWRRRPAGGSALPSFPSGFFGLLVLQP